MKREVLAIRKGNGVKFFGTAINHLGYVQWRYRGHIKYEQELGEYIYYPSFWMMGVTEKFVRVIDCEIEKLRKEHGKV